MGNTITSTGDTTFHNAGLGTVIPGSVSSAAGISTLIYNATTADKKTDLDIIGGVFTGVGLASTAVGTGLLVSDLLNPPPNILDFYISEWNETSNMNHDRYRHTATLLPDGTVLVAGGGGFSQNTSEIYDPQTKLWTDASNMNHTRSGHTATLLPNGTVLVAGGNDQNTSEIYDPQTKLWVDASNMNHTRYRHTATLLPNGTVLVAGGGGNGQNTSEIYNPTVSYITVHYNIVHGSSNLSYTTDNTIISSSESLSSNIVIPYPKSYQFTLKVNRKNGKEDQQDLL